MASLPDPFPCSDWSGYARLLKPEAGTFYGCQNVICSKIFSFENRFPFYIIETTNLSFIKIPSGTIRYNKLVYSLLPPDSTKSVSAVFKKLTCRALYLAVVGGSPYLGASSPYIGARPTHSAGRADSPLTSRDIVCAWPAFTFDLCGSCPW